MIFSNIHKSLTPNKGGWDGSSGILHELDNATGLRAENKRGEQWICYGDATFFIEPNRVNRLKRFAICLGLPFYPSKLTLGNQY